MPVDRVDLLLRTQDEVTLQVAPLDHFFEDLAIAPRSVAVDHKASAGRALCQEGGRGFQEDGDPLMRLQGAQHHELRRVRPRGFSFGAVGGRQFRPIEQHPQARFGHLANRP